jgi:hypothetical protein
VLVFGRNWRSPKDRFVLSANVQEQDECWHLTWLGDGRMTPPDYEAASLTEVTDLATAAALAAYRAGPRVRGAMLTFAIYPDGHGTREFLYKISGSPGRFKARCIEDDTRYVQAADLEQLIKAARRQAHTDYAMLIWIRPLEEFLAE